MIMYLSNYIVANPFQRQARLARATAMPTVCVSSLNKYSDNLMRHYKLPLNLLHTKYQVNKGDLGIDNI